MEVQQSHLEDEQSHFNTSEEIDSQQATLSTSKLSKGTEKLDLYRLIKKKKKFCLIFDTQCEVYLFITITALILLALFLVFDNQVQERQIDQILNTLKRDDGKSSTQAALSNDQMAKTQGKDDNSYNGQRHQNLLPNEIPKKIWYYNKQNGQENRPWTQKCYERVKQIAQLSGYSLSLISQSNFKGFLSPIKQQKIDFMQKEVNKDKKKSKEFIELVVKQITVLEILLEKGGIFIDEDIVVTEPLHWIGSLSSNEFVNARQLLKEKAKVIGFHSVQYSSEMQKGDIQASQQTEKYMVLHPSLNFYFLATVASSKFIEDLLSEYYEIVANYYSIHNLLQKFKIQVDFYRDNKLNDDRLFQVACQLALRKRELQLDANGKAIEFYHIASINENYGPAKLRSYLGDTQIDKIFNHLSLLTLPELEYEFGSIRYMACFTNRGEIHKQFEKIVQSKSTIKNSFIHHYLLANEPDLIEVKTQAPSMKAWTTLPTKLWMYLKEPPFKNAFFMQVWIEHLKKSAKLSGFDFNIVTENTLTLYLHKTTIDSINLALISNKLNLYENSRSQLISLAVLYEQGGVWVQPYAFFLDNLNWLSEIGKQKFLWNRFGELPKVAVVFHPHFGSPFHWVYGQSGAKEAWHLAYEHSVIAAQPKSQLIKDWFDGLRDNIQLSYTEIITKFEKCKINNHKWISQKNQDLLSQDSIKCVLGTKTIELQGAADKRSATEFYGLWGLNGFAGLLKTREYTNFVQRRSMENPFIWRYSFDHTQKVIGKISHIAKIYQSTASKIQQLYLANFDNPTKQVHSQSLLMRLINQTGGKVMKAENRLYLSNFQEDYELAQTAVAESASLQQLSKMSKIVWIYQGGDIDTSDFTTKYILKNINHYSQLSGFEVRIVNDKNYKLWLIAQSQYTKKLNNFLNDLERKLDNQVSNLKDHYLRIKGQIILMTLLYEFGGVFISKRIILHEDFNWIKDIQNLHFINKEGNTPPPKVFGFHSPGYSSQANNKQIVQLPSLQNFFMASGKKTPFVKDFIDQYISIISDKDSVKKRLQTLKLDINMLHGNDPYYEAFFIACQFTFRKKNDELKSLNSPLTAIEQYGLYTFNTHFYPYKLHRYYSSFKTKGENVAKSLAEMFLEELEEQVGKFRLLSVIPEFNDVRKYIENAVNAVSGYTVKQNSFLHVYFMPSQSKGITKRMVRLSKPAVSSKIWDKLPLKAYIYVPYSISSSSLSTQILFSALKAKLHQVGIELVEVNDRNIEEHVDKFILRKINRFIGTGYNGLHKELLYRLAVLFKNGGISVTTRILAVDDVKWIKEIGSIDKKIIFNPYGNNPKVLLSVDHLRSPFHTWNYSQELQARIGNSIGWSSAFMAAEKQNELVKEWLEELTSYLQMNEKDLSQQFEQCKIKQSLWSSLDPSKLGFDALICVLNRKQIDLEKTEKTTACEHYGLWGIDESTGLNKLSDGLNLDYMSADLNPFLWKQPRAKVQELVGPIKYLVELSEKQMEQLDALVRRQKLKSWGDKDSILVQTVFNTIKPLLKEQSGQISLKS